MSACFIPLISTHSFSLIPVLFMAQWVINYWAFSKSTILSSGSCNTKKGVSNTGISFFFILWRKSMNAFPVQKRMFLHQANPLVLPHVSSSLISKSSLLINISLGWFTFSKNEGKRLYPKNGQMKNLIMKICNYGIVFCWTIGECNTTPLKYFVRIIFCLNLLDNGIDIPPPMDSALRKNGMFFS